MRLSKREKHVRRRTKGRESAFTLVEVVVVIVVLAVLGSIAVPRFIDFNDSSKVAATKEGLVDLREQIQLLYLKDAVSGGEASYPSLGNLKSATKDTGPSNPYSPEGSDDSKIRKTPNNTNSANYGAGGWAYDPSTGDIRANSYSGAGEHTW